MADDTRTTPEHPVAVDKTPISPSRSDAGRKGSLEAHLKHRPNRSELVDKNILPATNAAPAIQAQQKDLERSMLADHLKDKISHRPSPEKLVQDGVLHDDPRSPDEKYMEAIEDEYAKREGGA